MYVHDPKPLIKTLALQWLLGQEEKLKQQEHLQTQVRLAYEEAQRIKREERDKKLQGQVKIQVTPRAPDQQTFNVQHPKPQSPPLHSKPPHSPHPPTTQKIVSPPPPDPEPVSLSLTWTKETEQQLKDTQSSPKKPSKKTSKIPRPKETAKRQPKKPEKKHEKTLSFEEPSESPTLNSRYIPFHRTSTVHMNNDEEQNKLLSSLRSEGSGASGKYVPFHRTSTEYLAGEDDRDIEAEESTQAVRRGFNALEELKTLDEELEKWKSYSNFKQQSLDDPLVNPKTPKAKTPVQPKEEKPNYFQKEIDNIRTPTPRQQQILDQLKELRQGLLQKKKEHGIEDR